MRRILPLGFSILLLLTFCFPQDGPTTGSIRGQVVTRNQNGEPAVLRGTRIVLRGPTNREAQSDASGAFAIDGLPPGMYDVEASAPGLNSTLAVEVKPGTTSMVPIELSIAAVTDTVTVAANDPPAIEESAQKNTISQRTVEEAPNQSEKIENLLPLVPGVVRGPDGRINMKGAQATQAGWLVNSANVTDPATGGQAINLPIDVVSSVQVISNPYDPNTGSSPVRSRVSKPRPATSRSSISLRKTSSRELETAMATLSELVLSRRVSRLLVPWSRIDWRSLSPSNTALFVRP